jgi:hypothetical protein
VSQLCEKKYGGKNFLTQRHKGHKERVTIKAVAGSMSVCRRLMNAGANGVECHVPSSFSCQENKKLTDSRTDVDTSAEY